MTRRRCKRKSIVDAISANANLFIIAGFFLLSIIYIDYNFTRHHELAHHQIYEYYGVDSNITVKFDSSALSFYGYTTPMPTNVSKESAQSIHFLNSLNEVVGYNVYFIIEAILCAGFMISYAILVR